MDDLNKKAWARTGWFLFEKGLGALIYGMIILVYLVVLGYLMDFAVFSTRYILEKGFSDKYVILSFVAVVISLVALVLFAVQKNIVAELKKEKKK